MPEADIIIRNINEAFIKVECPDNIAYELQDTFSFFVPGAQFTPKFRRKLWNGKIYLFNVITRQIYRGLAVHIENFAKERGYTFHYDCFDTDYSVQEAQKFIEKLNCSHVPRDYQIDFFVHAMRKKRYLMISSTGSGKSFSIYLIIRKILETKKKGLIIVPTTSLVEQLHSDFKEYSKNNDWNVDENVHKIYQGKDKNTNHSLTISTWQSLYKLPRKFFEQFDFVICDEVHGAKSVSLTTILSNMINTEYRIGTTGTLDGTKTNRMVLEGLFGPAKKIVSTKELINQKVLADFQIKCLLLKHSPEMCKAASAFTYQQEIEYLVLNESRNNFISKLALSLEGNTLVLFQYVEKHGKILYDLIEQNKNGDRKIFFIHGNTDVEAREEMRSIVEQESNAIIVGSFGTVSTGTNIKNLHNIIFASPAKSRIRNLQSIGRSLRISETKKSSVLFDIADDLQYRKKENYTLNHFSERIKIYSEEEFPFKIYKIELKDK